MSVHVCCTGISCKSPNWLVFTALPYSTSTSRFIGHDRGFHHSWTCLVTCLIRLPTISCNYCFFLCITLQLLRKTKLKKKWWETRNIFLNKRINNLILSKDIILSNTISIKTMKNTLPCGYTIQQIKHLSNFYRGNNLKLSSVHLNLKYRKKNPKETQNNEIANIAGSVWLKFMDGSVKWKLPSTCLAPAKI